MPGTGGLAAADQLHGKAMSYNNYVDADAARRAAYDFAEPCAAIIKHSNPCGIAIGADLAEAHRKAHACDPVSAFGGVIAVNGTVTPALASQIADVFTEVVVAPALRSRGAGYPVQGEEHPPARPARRPTAARGTEWRPVSGGLLMQSIDRVDAPGDDPANWELKTGVALDEVTLGDLAFAWRACRSVKSNAILLASGGASVGIGMGQVNRVDSGRLAVARAGDRAAGSVCASDAYFPFPDSIDVLAEAGVAAIAEPGGSIRDQLVDRGLRARPASPCTSPGSAISTTDAPAFPRPSPPAAARRPPRPLRRNDRNGATVVARTTTVVPPWPREGDRSTREPAKNSMNRKADTR